MMTRKRVCCRAAGVLVAVVYMAGADVALANDVCGADPGFSLSGKDGTNPETTGCAASAVTKCSASFRNSSGAVIGKVYLRFSTSCKTAWIKTVSQIGAVDLYSYLWSDIWANGQWVPRADCQSTDHATSHFTFQLRDPSGYRAYGWGEVFNRGGSFTCIF